MAKLKLKREAPPKPAASATAPVEAPVDGSAPKRSLLDIILRRKPPRAVRLYQPLPSDFDTGMETVRQMHDTQTGKKKSLMHKQKTLCNGQADPEGRVCQHYWSLVQIVPSANATALLEGERFRMCTLFGAEPIVFDEGKEGMAVQCNRYTPDPVVKYSKRDDPDHYAPLTPEEIDLIEKEVITSRDQLEEFRSKRANEVSAVAETTAPETQTISVDEAMKE